MNLAEQIAEHPPLESAYRSELARVILGELRKGDRSLARLVESAEGAYPSDVLSTLHGLEVQRQVSLSASGMWSLREPAQASTRAEPLRPERAKRINNDRLPEPHPLDYDWRFTTETLCFLTEKLSLVEGTSVAVLGAPTLYRLMIDSGIDAALFDRNPRLVRHLLAEGYTSVVECDLLDFPDVTGRYGCALADPPWYVEHYEAFLNAARKLLAPGGKLLLSVLPRLTRPSAPQDRSAILELASSQGFDLVEAIPSALRYVSPPFELEALRADGLSLEDWRTGDLYTLILSSRAPKATVKREATKGTEIWKTFQLGETSVKVRSEGTSGHQHFHFEGASAGGNIRLRSVSRRSPARSKINLWTSRNIALTVSKPVLVAEALQKLAGGESPAGTLASVTYEYQLTDAEKGKLQELLELLLGDAGLKWTQ